MTKNVVFFILMCIMTTYGYSQSLSPSVLATQGGSDKTEYISFEWTLGEHFVETVSKSDAIYTQGFQQSEIKVFKINKPVSLIDVNIKFAPNPVHDILNISIQSDQSSLFEVLMFDINGKLIIKESIYSNISITELDVKQLSAGTYLLQISNKDRSIIENYKISKIN